MGIVEIVFQENTKIKAYNLQTVIKLHGPKKRQKKWPDLQVALKMCFYKQKTSNSQAVVKFQVAMKLVFWDFQELLRKFEPQ